MDRLAQRWTLGKIPDFTAALFDDVGGLGAIPIGRCNNVGQFAVATSGTLMAPQDLDAVDSSTDGALLLL